MNEFDVTIKTMIAEQGEVWEGCRDFENRTDSFNAVVVTDSPDRCFRLALLNGEWATFHDKPDVDELARFFAAFGSHWRVMIGSLVSTNIGYVKVRAFIKNGRKRGGWSISIDSSPIIQVAATASALSQQDTVESSLPHKQERDS